MPKPSLLIAEVDDSGASNEVIRSYTWGLDLSGSEQGAGGVGGLLMVHEGSKTHFVAMDGNGNVSALTDGTTVTAEYEYGPFGEVLKVLGEIGNEMPIRFSSKYQYFETGLVYYGFRYYSNAIGRWLNRDLIGEDGVISINVCLKNNLISYIDFLGLRDLFQPMPITIPPSILPDYLILPETEYATNPGPAVTQTMLGITSALWSNNIIDRVAALRSNSLYENCFLTAEEAAAVYQGAKQTVPSDARLLIRTKFPALNKYFDTITDQYQKERMEEWDSRCFSIYEEYKSTDTKYLLNPCSKSILCTELKKGH